MIGILRWVFLKADERLDNLKSFLRDWGFYELELIELSCWGEGGALTCFNFDMGGCFPCFGSSNKEGSGLKEVSKKDSVKDGSSAQSNHGNRVSLGNKQ